MPDHFLRAHSPEPGPPLIPACHDARKAPLAQAGSAGDAEKHEGLVFTSTVCRLLETDRCMSPLSVIQKIWQCRVLLAAIAERNRQEEGSG